MEAGLPPIRVSTYPRSTVHEEEMYAEVKHHLESLYPRSTEREEEMYAEIMASYRYEILPLCSPKEAMRTGGQ